MAADRLSDSLVADVQTDAVLTVDEHIDLVTDEVTTGFLFILFSGF